MQNFLLCVQEADPSASTHMVGTVAAATSAVTGALNPMRTALLVLVSDDMGRREYPLELLPEVS